MRNRSDFQKLANTRYLTRILTYLGETDFANFTTILEATGVPSGVLKDALTWLYNHGLIVKVHGDSCMIYYKKNE